MSQLKGILSKGRVKSYVLGRMCGGGGRVSTLYAPRTGRALAPMEWADGAVVEAAVVGGRKALAPWEALGAEERGRVLGRVAELLERDEDLLVGMEGENTGKSAEEARWDVREAATVFRHFSGLPTRLHGTCLRAGPGMAHRVEREAIGVCGLIVPSNYPLVMAAWKVGPALACGNTAVLKPAEETPLTALHLGQLVHKAGGPDGLLGVVVGGAEVGRLLVEHRDIGHVSFTGGPRGGQGVAQLAAAQMERMLRPTLELGGKNTAVVDRDVSDMDKVVEGLLGGAYANAGQNCAAASRILLHREVHAKVVARMREGVRGLEGGYLISRAAQERALSTIAEARTVAAYEVVQGRGGEGEGEGFRVPATMILGAADEDPLSHQEHFSPILTVMAPFDTIDEAIGRVNATGGAIASGIWSRDVGRVERFVRGVRAGTVWVNGWNVTPAWVPFGGVGPSGYGRDLGEECLHEFTITKTVTHFL